jgi:hypothetical protein
MFNAETTTSKTGGATYEKGDTSWKHPSEFGRVSAWVKRTKNDLALEKEIYGHPPSIVFEIQAPNFIEVQTIDPPDGLEPPGQGRAYVEASDGTPAICRNISFTPAAGGASTTENTADNGADGGSTENQAARPEKIRIPNPDWIPQSTMKKLTPVYGVIHIGSPTTRGW